MAAPKNPNTEAARAQRAANAQRRKLSAATQTLVEAGVDQWVAELLAGLSENELLQIQAKLEEISSAKS